MSERQIIVAGGGIGGLAAALACARAGRQSLVLERTQAFEEVGAGLQIGPNAVRALEALEAWQEVARIVSAPPDILMHDASTGALVRRIALGDTFVTRFGAPYRVAHRADLHASLLASALHSPLIRILNGQDIDTVTQNADSVMLTTTQGSQHNGDMLVAADGMNSRLRQNLWPNSAAVFAGQILHRALIDMPGDMPDADCVKLWMGPGYHVVHYPVGIPARLNIICVAHVGQSPREIAALACGQLHNLLQSVSNWLPWDAKHVPPLTHWHKGRIMLLGDAAHGTVPFFAQGAAMALEDAALLFKTLNSGAGPSDVASAMSSRIPRVSAVHAASVRQGKIYSASGVVARARNVVLRAMPERAFLGQLAWLYQHEG